MMPHTDITVYGAPWCSDCKRAKKFLGEQRVHYHWVDVEADAAGLSPVERVNQGKRIIPTIVFEDGSALSEPSNAELAAKLGLQTRASMSYCDLIVVGGGPAGLTTALYAAREGLDMVVIERSGLGGQAGSKCRRRGRDRRVDDPRLFEEDVREIAYQPRSIPNAAASSN